MKYKSYSVYDDDEFLQAYLSKRAKGRSPNEILEEPIINELLGDVKGKHIIDLGCGDGNYGNSLINKGAAHYHGVDGSKNMIELAQQNLKNASAVFQCNDLENIVLPIEKYDLALSRLVLHYIEDLGPLLTKVEATLKKGGSFICSVEHPVITSCYDAYHKKTKRRNWIVDNYFHSGERTNIWIGKAVIKYHKTIETYFQLFQKANFEIAQIRESKPLPQYFEDQTEYERRMRIPLFMLFKLNKKD